jgi:hypothetical protein
MPAESRLRARLPAPLRQTLYRERLIYILTGWRPFGRRPAGAGTSKLNFVALDRPRVHRFYLATAVVIRCRDRELYLTAANGTILKRKVKFIAEHFAGKCTSVHFELERDIFLVTATARRLTCPYARQIGAEHRRGNREPGEISRKVTVHDSDNITPSLDSQVQMIK